ncbi:MAG: non-lysosomal glucosylceramidase [Limisphaera sp.]|jgi:uncharacterized protein (DUF608 family)|nr:non-lysosomal glucosylceramidase [Limisphaera sp.]
MASRVTPSAARGMRRREFLKLGAAGLGATGVLAGAPAGWGAARPVARRPDRQAGWTLVYEGERLRRVAFPLGGFGAGMLCLEGTGALSHVSLRHRPEIFHEPVTFGAVCIRGEKPVARVLEGPVPDWKKFGQPGSGNGAAGTAFGLPRFRGARFEARFPFARVTLWDAQVPLRVQITGWSPFEPGDADACSLPVAALEYRFTNPTRRPLDVVFSWSARNFMAVGRNPHAVRAVPGGFLLEGIAPKERGWESGAFTATVDEPEVHVNHAWFRGGWFDPLTMAWKDIAEGRCVDRPPVTDGTPAPGATLFVPFRLEPRATRTVILRFAWYVGETNLRYGRDPEGAPPVDPYRPWYAARFSGIGEVTEYWRRHYADLRERSQRFSDCFHASTLPPEVMEAVAANLTILKSPTVLRQADGRLWAFEGCSDNSGCCHGSCTHVWNYAQAIPHLFPALERTLRETEFGPSQDERGHQQFRSNLPIRPTVHDFHAAADGQLGGIMKMYREWRISGDTKWLRRLWPRVRQSLEYCITTWDPHQRGWLEEPHHNTYDIEFFGPDGMCTSFYLGALRAAVEMGRALGEEVQRYETLLAAGRQRMETELWNGEYFIQKVQWSPGAVLPGADSPEAAELIRREGPKYQYGTGCLSDGVLGDWLARMCGVPPVLDEAKVRQHLLSVYRYNLREDLTDHANPQRPSYACGAEGGLLLCTWPKGGMPSLPFVYSNEVWTGIEYQVASHLMLLGHVAEGLHIVRTARARYDGRVRNPFNEYECGHWYARALSSYGLLLALSGARYDAVTRVLHLRPRLRGDFQCFIATATGYGLVGVRRGRPFLEVRGGRIDVAEIRLER